MFETFVHVVLGSIDKPFVTIWYIFDQAWCSGYSVILPTWIDVV